MSNETSSIPPTYDFIAYLLDKNVEEIIPVFDVNCGFRYPYVEEFFHVDSSHTAEILDVLVEHDILDRSLFDKILLCPNCLSANIRTIYICPYCGSKFIVKHRVLEHFACGTLAEEEKFKKNGKLICPKCGVQLKKLNDDYRVAGIWCECTSCGRDFDNPFVQHICLNCNSTFRFEDAVYRNVYLYRISEQAKRELKGKFKYLLDLKDALNSLGFECHIKQSITGLTGISHSFDLTVAKSRDERRFLIGIDLAVSGSILDERYIAAIFTKAYDVKCDETILIAMPQVSEDARRLVATYGIYLIEGEDFSKIKEKLISHLRKF